MSAPNLTITVQPLQNGKATYLPLAAATLSGKLTGKIVLRLDIKNNGDNPVTITGITFAFPGSQIAPSVMQAVDSFFSGYYSKSGGAVLLPGQTKVYTNGLVNVVPDDKHTQVNNALFLPDPIPANITAQVTCSGFTEPAIVSRPLAAHRSPTAQGSYLFPYSATDLRIAEYFVGSAVHWANGGLSGNQIFAHDFGCEGFDAANHSWSRLLPGKDKDGSKNPHYRIYGKPIRSMADGTVLAWSDQSEENTLLGKLPDPTPAIGTGNSVTVVCGDEKIIYCHMQKGSIPVALQKVGTPVKAGQVIGVVGNTGNASEPHTHIEVELNTAANSLRPFPFHDAYVISQNSFVPPDPAGDWSRLKGRGLPKETVAVWPSASAPAWYPPGWEEVTRFGISESSYQKVFDHVTSSGYRPVWIDGYEVKGKTYLNAIFRPQTNVPWIARHGLSAAEFQVQFDSATADGYRLTNVASYVSGGSLAYAGIFDKVNGPAWHAYHGIRETEHKARFKEWANEGYAPVNVSITSADGTPRFTAFYTHHDVGGFVHGGGLTSGEYQEAWNSNAAAGRQLAYLGAYQQGGSARFSAIFQEKTPGSENTVGKHNMTGPQLQEQYDAGLAIGRLTRVLVGYEVNGSAMFAGAWRKA